jgi:hypothetical protein
MQISEKTTLDWDYYTSADESRKRDNGRSNYLTACESETPWKTMNYVYVTQCTKRKGNFPSEQYLHLTLVPKGRATQKQNMVQTDRWLWKCGRARNHGNNAKDNITISNLHLKPPIHGTLKSKSPSQSITESKRHRPASKQWTTQAASHGFEVSFSPGLPEAWINMKSRNGNAGRNKVSRTAG